MAADRSAIGRLAKPRRAPRIEIPSLGPAEILATLGTGRRCTAVRARCRTGRDIVLKLFTPAASAKHERRHAVPLARYEYERNLALWGVPGLQGCVAQPLGYVADGARQILAQQLLDGTLLERFAWTAQEADRRAVSEELARVVTAAHDAEFFDLDLHPANVLVCRKQGSLRVMLFDFDRIPYHIRPPNPIAGVLVACGLITARSRDLRRLKAIDKLLLRSGRQPGAARSARA